MCLYNVTSRVLEIQESRRWIGFVVVRSELVVMRELRVWEGVKGEG